MKDLVETQQTEYKKTFGKETIISLAAFLISMVAELEIF